MIKDDIRINALINEILPCKYLADIGSDHGYVAVIAKLSGLCEVSIASDISSPSISKADRLIKECNVDNVFTRVGDGVKTLKNEECDTVVIAGMGGTEIVKILKEGKRRFNRYILSPHKNSEILRRYLSENNLCAIKDYKIKNKTHFYDIIVAESGYYNPSEREILYGKLDNEYVLDYIQYEESRILKLLDKVNGKKLVELKKKLDLLRG